MFHDSDGEILKKRAVELARPVETVEVETLLPVIEFQLASEVYAFELCYVKKVVPVSQLVDLPGTPNFVAGICHLSGQILSVIDLRMFFDLPVNKGDRCQTLVLLQAQHMQLAILAEEILGVRELKNSSLQERLPTLTGVRERYLKGVTPDQTIVLDAECLIGDETLIVNQSS